MSKTSSVSVVISAFNEEKKIRECIESVQWAAEIILIDNTSTDSTAAIAKKLGAKVYTRKNNLMLNVNKNFGFSKASHNWILSLDADERITPDLQKEIIETLSNENLQYNAFSIPRKNIIFGKWIEHTGWYPDYQLRLFKKNFGKFEERHVHEQIVVEGQISTLKNPMTHMHYDSISQFLHKTFIIYAPNEASEYLRKGYQFNYLDALRFPLNEFFSRYFAREGYKDGLHGLVLSLLMAAYHLVVFSLIWEQKNFIEKDNIEHEVEEELKKESRDMRYWFTTLSLNRSSNILREIFLRLKRKMYTR